MYEAYFGFTEAPFSIAPNPHYLYMSGKHREAMAHLLYGIREGGGFVQLTGEVGTGKTTLCRQLLAELPDNVDVALILNPRIDELELMQAVCDELKIPYDKHGTIKQLLDALNRYLLDAHARGRHTVLVIDEAQNLSNDVLEQVRLLTNLETTRKKLLQIILIGQPELKEHLEQKALRQLSQRITARFHLYPLNRREVRDYIRYRLKRGGSEKPLFTALAVSRIYRRSRGVPRVINVLCDRALLGAYARGRSRVTSSIVGAAARELRGNSRRRWPKVLGWAAGLSLFLLAPVAAYTFGWLPERVDREIRQIVPSWMPRLNSGGLTRQASHLLTWPITSAHAGEVSAEDRFELDPVAPAERRSLEGPRPTPVNLSALKPLSAAEGLALLSRLKPESRSRVAAMRALADVWSVPTALVFDCVGVGEFGLACRTELGGWDSLVRLDRPAVVEVGGEQETTGHALLRYVIGESVVLQLDGTDYVMPVADFSEIWLRSGLVFWRTPPIGQVPVDEFSSDEDILWLRRALNLEAANAGGKTLSSVERPLFDSELIAVLRGFQRRNGLAVRELAGEEELILLNTRLGYEIHPKLVY